MAELIDAIVSGVETKVMDAQSPNGTTGICVTVLRNRLLIAITRAEEGLCVALPFDPADEFCNLLADKFLLLTAGTAPTTETRQ